MCVCVKGLVGSGIKVSGRMKGGGGGGGGLPVESVGGLCCRRGKQAEMEVRVNPGIWSSAPPSEHDGGGEDCSHTSLICNLEFVSVSVQTAATHTSTYEG